MADTITDDLPSEVLNQIMDRSGQMCEACEEEFGTKLYSKYQPVVESPPEDILLLCPWCYERETNDG